VEVQPNLRSEGEKMDFRLNFTSLLLSLVLLIAILSGGCVGNTDKPGAGDTVTIVSTTEQTAGPVNSEDDGTFKVELPGSLTSSALPVSYDEETKKVLVENAKKEILRVFPEVKESSLDNYRWDNEIYDIYYAPAIIFEDVIDESKTKERIAANKWFTENIVRIAVDPETGRIRYYKGISGSSSTSKPIISVEEAKDHAVNLFINALGEEYYNEKKDDYSIYTMDHKIAYPDDTDFEITVFIMNSYNGIKYLNDGAEIRYDTLTDSLSSYSNNFNQYPDLLAEITTLSPVPDITLDQAKKILEAKLNENDPGKDLEIEYHENYEGSVLPSGYYNSLYWMDSSNFMNISDGYVREPLRLVWRFYFNTGDMRDNPDETVRKVYIDAHTGEIVYLRYPGISIPANI
jgi:hypothetical protein